MRVPVRQKSLGDRTYKTPKTHLNKFRPPVTLSLLSTPTLRAASPNSWDAKPAVVLLQDGACNILINTGLPSQGPEIVEELTSRRIFDAQFTVATSPHLQFSGNLNLFPNAQIIAGRWHARDTKMTRWNTGLGYRMDLCSQSTYTIPTPGIFSIKNLGPSEDAITCRRWVRWP
ncbi:unnamed protein product, partial [Mesorhabditis spiculigera]